MDIDEFKDDQRHLRPPRRRPRAARGRAARCAARIRPYDICVRYAGDEFIVVLSDCGARGGRSASGCELQARIDEIEFEVAAGQDAAARRQRRRRGLPARRHDLRGAARRRRPPHVSRQGRAPRPRSPRAGRGRVHRAERSSRRSDAARPSPLPQLDSASTGAVDPRSVAAAIRAYRCGDDRDTTRPRRAPPASTSSARSRSTRAPSTSSSAASRPRAPGRPTATACRSCRSASTR